MIFLRTGIICKDYMNSYNIVNFLLLPCFIANFFLKWRYLLGNITATTPLKINYIVRVEVVDISAILKTIGLLVIMHPNQNKLFCLLRL